MRIGILADIHEAVPETQQALDLFRAARVEEVLVLGDVCAMGRDLPPTVELLRQAGAVGVWGNHDFGLCRAPSGLLRRRHPPALLEYLATFAPRLERDGCHFSHVEPWLDPNDMMQLWYYEGVPDTPARAARSFAAVPHRALFVGHFHRWLAVTPAGVVPWEGDRPLRLEPGRRYLIVIHAVCRGHCAVLDTAAGELVPLALEVQTFPEGEAEGRTKAP
jgi:hypothetical protein